MNMKKVLWILNLKDKTGYYYSPGIIWWYGILENMGYEVVYYPYEEYNIENLYEMVKENGFDFIIIGAYSIIHTEIIRLKELSKVYVLQSDDRWRYDGFGKYWISFVDGIITFEGEFEKYISDGLKPEQFNKMKWSFNPNTMTLPVQNHEYKYFVSHTGGMHGNRQQIIDQFNSRIGNIHIDQSPDYDKTKEVWASSKYSLCLTNNSLNTGKELKGRVVEIPNFCVLLTEPFPDMEQYYDMDSECILFNSIDEAIEKMNMLEKDNNYYSSVFSAGKRRLWNSNTVYHEWNKILLNIDPDFKQINPIQILKEKHGDFYYA